MLTYRQRDALQFIVAYQRQNDGISPSYAEIAKGIGARSKTTVLRVVCDLEERGAIRRLRDRARAIEVLRLPSGTEVKPELEPPIDRFRVFRFDDERKELVEHEVETTQARIEVHRPGSDAVS